MLLPLIGLFIYLFFENQQYIGVYGRQYTRRHV